MVNNIQKKLNAKEIEVKRLLVHSLIFLWQCWAGTPECRHARQVLTTQFHPHPSLMHLDMVIRK